MLESDLEEYWPNLEISAFDTDTAENIAIKGTYRGRNLGFYDPDRLDIRFDSTGTKLRLIWDKKVNPALPNLSGYSGELTLQAAERDYTVGLGIETKRNGLHVSLQSI